MSATTIANRKPVRRINSSWLIYGIVGGIGLAASIGSYFLNRHLKQTFVMPPQPLPIYGKVEADFSAKDPEGKDVRFSAMKGKVIACSYLFTKCPMGCAEVFRVMKVLEEKYGSNPDFHLTSIAVVPDLDPPDFLKAFAQSQGVGAEDSWTFMSGHERADGWNFMHQQLKLEMTREIPEKDRLSACDVCDHDLRIVLIDRSMQVRGYYQVMVPDKETRDFTQERLVTDVGRLLKGE